MDALGGWGFRKGPSAPKNSSVTPDLLAVAREPFNFPFNSPVRERERECDDVSCLPGQEAVT